MGSNHGSKTSLHSRSNDRYSTIQQTLGLSLQSNLTSKWNQKYTKDMCRKNSGLLKLNIGASFLVSPVNTTSDKNMTEALDKNKTRVEKKLGEHLKYYQDIEDNKCRGLSEESIKEKKKHRPPQVRRIENMLNTITSNNLGSKVHGRGVKKPHSIVVQRIQKYSPRDSKGMARESVEVI